MSKHNLRWPEGLWEQAHALIQSGLTFKGVARKLGIAEQSLHSKAKWERMSPEQKERKNARSRNHRAALREEKKKHRPYNVEMSPPRRQFVESAAHRPGAELIADRDRRLSIAPRNLTAALQGDPLPGYSALERRA